MAAVDFLVLPHENASTFDVYFCCDKCPKAFTDDPEKFEEKLPQFAEDAADEEDDA